MASHSHVIKMCLSCNQENQSQSKEQINIQDIYRQFSKTLEQELHIANSNKNQIIDRLSDQISDLKMINARLESRNKTDQDSQKRLRVDYNQLLFKFKNMNSPNTEIKVEIVQKVKEIVVKEKDLEDQQEIQRLKHKINQINMENKQINIDKGLLTEQNEQLRHQLNTEIRNNKKCLAQIENLRKQFEEQSNGMIKIQSQNEYLKNNKQIIIEKQYIFPQFKPAERSQPQIKIETIYIEKPVQKLVFVDIEKKITRFIQPEKPLISRIIQCESTAPKFNQEQESYYEIELTNNQKQIAYLKGSISELEGNVKQYRNEREQLVSIIQKKNTELNEMQTKIRLFCNFNSDFKNTNQINKNYEDSVDVTVTKLYQHEKKSEGKGNNNKNSEKPVVEKNARKDKIKQNK